mmetsp:Transcript_47499/g.93671  ORF Transcript_47499/g.93671 Transcript_47499/m.93671 type:complete len:203 (+) Transcript_47499:1035-1643(+)
MLAFPFFRLLPAVSLSPSLSMLLSSKSVRPLPPTPSPCRLPPHMRHLLSGEPGHKVLQMVHALCLQLLDDEVGGHRDLQVQLPDGSQPQLPVGKTTAVVPTDCCMCAHATLEHHRMVVQLRVLERGTCKDCVAVAKVCECACHEEVSSRKSELSVEREIVEAARGPPLSPGDQPVAALSHVIVVHRACPDRVECVVRCHVGG